MPSGKKNRSFIALAAAVLGLCLTHAQAQTRTDVTALRAFAKTSALKAKKDKESAIRMARLLGLPIVQRLPGGIVRELMRFEGSIPIYYQTANLGAAQTVGDTKLWPGGITGLNLTGSGITLGEWDAGSALLTHREIVGRAVSPDSASPFDHSTHVAGTLIASGVDPNAKGMSFEGNLRSFDWNSDDAEMAVEAAAGLVLSNHSYRSFVYEYGDWCISRDTISYDAPYYLICQAAGNEGSSYRTLGDPACSKNSLTVGAVTKNLAGYSGPSSVTIADFSSRGPTPDGRIKPDIVAPGVDLYSSSSAGNDAYETMSGTSMATPCTCGSLGLIVQYYRSTHSGNDMLSSTLRGLVIHTADEAGPADGPDYDFGWGQLDTNSACVVIKESLTNSEEIQEQTLNDGQTFTYTVASDGVLPMKVTLCWTDPPGPNIGSSNTPALVNDLDLRVSNGGTVYQPWVLDNNNPSAPATTGDNSVDNVEQVVLHPVAGACVITVKTKDGATLKPSGSQRFSLIVTGATAPHLTGFTISPTSLTGGDTATGTVTLDLPAPSSGLQVALTNTNKTALQVPAAVRIPAGLTKGTFTVLAKTVQDPTTASVTATLGTTSLGTVVTVGPSWLTSLVLNPASVAAGSTATGTVTIGKPAGAGGAIVTLASSNTSVADVNWYVTIPEGATSATFSVATKEVAAASLATISASYPGPTRYATLTVTPSQGVLNLTVTPSTVAGGRSARGTVTLTMPVATDTLVSLTSSDPSVASVPGTVLVRRGARSAGFTISTTRTRIKKQVTVRASVDAGGASANLTVNP